MSKIIPFDKAGQNITEEKGMSTFTMPTPEEIAALNIVNDQYGKGEMVDIAHWNGACWQRFFKLVEKYANTYNFDAWDCFAVVLTKFLGTEFILEDDKITIKTKKQ